METVEKGRGRMRVTIDLDERNEEKLLKIIAYFVKNFKVFPEVRISSSGRGYHVVVRGLNISFEESIRLRKKLGDDAKRIEFDLKTKFKPKQILFREKNGKKAKVICRQFVIR